MKNHYKRRPLRGGYGTITNPNMQSNPTSKATKKQTLQKQPKAQKVATTASGSGSTAKKATTTTLAPRVEIKDDPVREIIKNQKSVTESLIIHRQTLQIQISKKESKISDMRAEAAALSQQSKTASQRFERAGPKDNKAQLKKMAGGAEKVARDKMWDISIEEGILAEMRRKLELYDRSSVERVNLMKSELNFSLGATGRQG